MTLAKKRSNLPGLGIILLLAGCNLAPHYEQPESAAPGQFKEAVPPSAQDAQGWKPAEPKDAVLRGNWWELYNDPQLNELEERVAISNQTVAAAEASFRSARALLSEASASLFPSLNLAPSVVRSRSSAALANGGGGSSSATSAGAGTTPGPGGGGGTGPRNYFTLPVEASYELDLWGSVRNSIAQSRFSAEASAAAVETALLSTQSTLAQSYYALRALDEERRILDTTLTDYEASLHLVTTLYNNGLASEEDMAEADTQLASAEAQATDLGIARAQYEHAIAVLIGVPPGQFSIPVRPFVAALPTIPVGLPAELLERRPDIAAAERQVAAANAGIGLARAAYFPNVTLSAYAGFEATNLSQLFNWPNRIWAVGPSVAQSLYDGGLRRAEVMQARALYDADVATYRQAVLAAFQSVEDDLSSLRILSKEVTQQHKAAVAAQHEVELSVVRYKDGLDSYVNVITAQNAFLQNRLAELQVQLRQITATIVLVDNLGGGWDRSQWKQTEDMALHPPGAGKRAEVPARNAGPAVPNPAPLPNVVKRPEDLLKQNAADMAPSTVH
jgi:NodT family efflux transporter outer membrane factor (OMF) lipoprotein